MLNETELKILQENLNISGYPVFVIKDIASFNMLSFIKYFNKDMKTEITAKQVDFNDEKGEKQTMYICETKDLDTYIRLCLRNSANLRHLGEKNSHIKKIIHKIFWLDYEKNPIPIGLTPIMKLHNLDKTEKAKIMLKLYERCPDLFITEKMDDLIVYYNLKEIKNISSKQTHNIRFNMAKQLSKNLGVNKQNIDYLDPTGQAIILKNLNQPTSRSDYLSLSQHQF